MQLEMMAYVPDRQLGAPGALSLRCQLYLARAGSYHRTRPLCHDSSLSRRRKSNVMSPEQTSTVTGKPVASAIRKMLAVKLEGNTKNASGSQAVAGNGPINRKTGCIQ